MYHDILYSNICLFKMGFVFFFLDNVCLQTKRKLQSTETTYDLPITVSIETSVRYLVSYRCLMSVC